MTSNDETFRYSLDVSDAAIEPYLPYLLQDFDSIGSMPEYALRILQKHLQPNQLSTAVDYGCGKGAMLHLLAQHFNFTATGVDLVPEFIEAATARALELGLNQRLQFIAGDMRAAIATASPVDLVIYGYDSEVLGDVQESVEALKPCLAPGGHVLIEVAWSKSEERPIEGLPGEATLREQLAATDFELIAESVWAVEDLQAFNRQALVWQRKRAAELQKQYPEKKALFQGYIEEQIDACREVEEDMLCATWLLRPA